MTDDTVLSPGHFIRKELEKRNWTQEDLAKIIAKPVGNVNRIIQGKFSITPRTAVALSEAFGTEADVWMERDAVYRLSLTVRRAPEIQRRAALYQIAPVKEMERRRWIPKTKTADDLERAICDFYEIGSTADTPQIAATARSSTKGSSLTSDQIAWCQRGKHLSRCVRTKKFDPSNLDNGLREIRVLARHSQAIVEVPKVLANLGIKLVILEPILRSKIDGAAFWADKSTPVILISMRYDRIDYFWFTLCHELSHIMHRDPISIDTHLSGDSGKQTLSEIEERADYEAADMLIPTELLDSFITRIKPLYSKRRIIQFANRVQIHPGIVTGQLQHRKELSWGQYRDLLVKVRGLITKSTLTDGWGKHSHPYQ